LNNGANAVEIKRSIDKTVKQVVDLIRQEIKEAIRARDKLIELVDKKWIVLETCGFEKYGRVLGNVYNIPQSLIYQNTNFEDYTPTNTLIDMCNIYNNKSLEYHVNFYMVEKKFGVPFMVKK
jgi:hypothetical protein